MCEKCRCCFEDLKEKLGNGGFTALELILAAVVVFLLGVIVGIFCSPKHMTIGCHNGTITNNTGCGDCCGECCGVIDDDLEDDFED